MDIPTPDQLPSPIQISEKERQQAPGTFDSLMQQNQDLTGRLSLSLRRAHELEKHVGQLVERNRYLELQAQALHTEMSQISERNKQVEYEFVSIRSQRDSAEIQLAEFQDEAVRRISTLTNRTSRLQKYRRKIRKQIRPMVDRLMIKIENDRQEYATTLQLNLQLREQVEQFKKQLTEAYQRIQNQHTEGEASKRVLVETYERKLEFYIQELEYTKSEHEKYQTLFKDLDAKYQVLLETQGEFENRAISAERKLEEHVQLTKNNLNEQKNTIHELRVEVGSLRSEKDLSQKETVRLQEKLKSTEESLSDVQAQYEGLQVLWQRAALDAEESREKLTSLQKLNKDLSTALQERRKENEFLMQKLEQADQKAAQKLANVYEAVRGLARENQGMKSLDFNEDLTRKDEALENIQRLLAAAAQSEVV